ncbi:MAG: hypothetical protein H6622_10695 [Halobacteriovoraceae bacterium]|nr:hypothetical protein [Halobacteriovoraceae bacterium]
MSLIQTIKDIHHELGEVEGRTRQNLLFCCGCMFLLLFSYPFMRSTTQALFMEHYGAKNTPVVWGLSIIVLGAAIAFYNKFQIKFKIQRIYNISAIFTVCFFILSFLILQAGVNFWVYPLYVAKEVYIVLLVNIVFGYVNSIVDVKLAKLVYGPIGAIGGIGGVLGGLLTSFLTNYWPVEWIFLFSLLFIAATVFIFWQTDHSFNLEARSDDGSMKYESPLNSIHGVGSYVAMLTLLIAITQFVINVGNFKFNLLFHELVPDKTEKTRYFGLLYSLINLLSVFVQIFITPLLFRYFKNRNIHFSITTIYSLATIIGFAIYGNSLIPVAITFIIYKGVDYSLFSTAKEILYFPLTNKQKYGAKYIVDMVCYRFSKGLISIVLIYFQSIAFINGALCLFLSSWFVVLIFLFKKRSEVLMKNKQILIQ